MVTRVYLIMSDYICKKKIDPTPRNVASYIWSLKTKICMLAESGNRSHWPFELSLNYCWIFPTPMDW